MNATLAYRRYCWSHSRAVFANNGKLRALRNILFDLPTFFC
jgi:hypothetical protein